MTGQQRRALERAQRVGEAHWTRRNRGDGGSGWFVVGPDYIYAVSASPAPAVGVLRSALVHVAPDEIYSAVEKESWHPVHADITAQRDKISLRHSLRMHRELDAVVHVARADTVARMSTRSGRPPATVLKFTFGDGEQTAIFLSDSVDPQQVDARVNGALRRAHSLTGAHRFTVEAISPAGIVISSDFGREAFVFWGVGLPPRGTTPLIATRYGAHSTRQLANVLSDRGITWARSLTELHGWIYLEPLVERLHSWARGAVSDRIERRHFLLADSRGLDLDSLPSSIAAAIPKALTIFSRVDGYDGEWGGAWTLEAYDASVGALVSRRSGCEAALVEVGK